MQFSNLFTILALAMAATAIPSAEPIEGDVLDTRDSGKCHKGYKLVCCSRTPLNVEVCIVAGDIACVDVQVGYCCKTNAPAVSFPHPFIESSTQSALPTISDIYFETRFADVYVCVCVCTGLPHHGYRMHSALVIAEEATVGMEIWCLSRAGGLIFQQWWPAHSESTNV